MVLVEVDGNYIDAEPMKNKSEGSIYKNLPDIMDKADGIRHSTTTNTHP
jgi:hypothetical protein